MTKDEAVQKLSKVARISVAYAEDLYDSFLPKPIVPQFVADWYEEHKDKFEINLFRFIYIASDTYPDDNLGEFENWLIADANDTLTTLVNMHQFGYEVKEETKYRIKLKGAREFNCYLNRERNKEFLFADKREAGVFKTEFTRKELENADFGWVFSCEGIEIEEVE